MVLREQCASRMESQRVAIVDSWKTYVFQTTDESLTLIPLLILHSGGGEEHAFVCHDFICPSKVIHNAC
jgi:hypothetical protein